MCYFNFFFEIKLLSNKNYPLNTKFKDLIPTCLVDLMFIHPNCFQNFDELENRDGWWNFPLGDNWVVFCTIWILYIF
jgi:hypothetical protein